MSPHRVGWALVAASLLPAVVRAQGDCYPSPRSNEAETFAIFAVPLAFGPGGAWTEAHPGQLIAGLELTLIPAVPTATATPTTCRPGKGPENTHLLPVLPRPRLIVGLPGGLFIDASWIPPLRVGGVKANLFGVALGRRFAISPASGVTLRGHATLGVVHAPITCDADAVHDPDSECFEGTVSDDAYHPNIFGLDIAVDRPLAARLRGHAGIGFNHLRPRFQVNFTNSVGATDRRRVSVDLDRLALFGGATWQARPGVTASGELYVAPKDAMTVRVVIRKAISD